MFTTYDALYGAMKNRFTVIDGKTECTLGEYMRNKANRLEKKNQNVASLHKAIAASKLKKVCEKKSSETTLTAFPLRTAASVLCAALSVCLAVFPLLNLKDSFAGFTGSTSPVSSVTPTVLEEEDIYTAVNL